jgi:hypothetical protein
MENKFNSKNDLSADQERFTQKISFISYNLLKIYELKDNNDSQSKISIYSKEPTKDHDGPVCYQLI